jgi:hypothetical protein
MQNSPPQTELTPETRLALLEMLDRIEQRIEWIEPPVYGHRPGHFQSQVLGAINQERIALQIPAHEIPPDAPGRAL